MLAVRNHLGVAEEPVWLITGASSGFELAIAEAALERGDRVVATARRPAAIEGFDEGEQVAWYSST